MNIEDNEPQFEIVRDVDHCSRCGHFHAPTSNCPPSGEPCGDFRCCID